MTSLSKLTLKKNPSSAVGLACLIPKGWGIDGAQAVMALSTIGFQTMKESSGGKGEFMQKKNILARSGIEIRAG